MSLRCRVGWHDWRYLTGELPSARLKARFPKALWLRTVKCQRCREERTYRIDSKKEPYVPPEGLEIMYPSANGTGHEVPVYEGDGWDKTCVRPGTREHGTMRDGSKPVRSACGHLYRDHGSMRYVGDGKTGFRPGPCGDCSCEGFLG